MSTSIMEKKVLNIVQAARVMFGRHGFTKTTMSDIANQAGVTRQTVYNAFGSKDDILRVVIREIGKQTLEQLKTEWAEHGTIEQKLAAFQRIGPLSWFTEVRNAPDWADILEGLNMSAASELAEIEKEWIALLNGMLNKELQTDAGGPAAVQDVSEFFYTASKNAKYGVDDPEDMKKRLATILEATMALLKSRGYQQA
ncbi:TetR/AcrR family transcriptional regulator [Roseobacter sp. CCS2]|uniref:TetR/AcrR family transcriptional regulator n=1 Tax=Roseobacter sp. CCS2 TaxID=391593 RepID=UPI0000F40044|nr:TetR/AcrR family transcriptional regulator [Roseobacter sp. CCS2]EBA14008.1 transcriptional regulator, TetR family protein [Roseobacter sp. CCS2]